MSSSRLGLRRWGARPLEVGPPSPQARRPGSWGCRTRPCASAVASRDPVNPPARLCGDRTAGGARAPSPARAGRGSRGQTPPARRPSPRAEPAGPESGAGDAGTRRRRIRSAGCSPGPRAARASSGEARAGLSGARGDPPLPRRAGPLLEASVAGNGARRPPGRRRQRAWKRAGGRAWGAQCAVTGRRDAEFSGPLLKMCAGCRRVARCHATPRRAPRRDRPGVGGLRGTAGSPGEPRAAGPRLSAAPRLVPGSAPHRTELGGSAQKGFGVTVTRSNSGKSALPPQALPDQRNVSGNVLICGAAVRQLEDQVETCFGDGRDETQRFCAQVGVCAPLRGAPGSGVRHTRKPGAAPRNGEQLRKILRFQFLHKR